MIWHPNHVRALLLNRRVASDTVYRPPAVGVVPLTGDLLRAHSTWFPRPTDDADCLERVSVLLRILRQPEVLQLAGIPVPDIQETSVARAMALRTTSNGPALGVQRTGSAGTLSGIRTVTARVEANMVYVDDGVAKQAAAFGPLVPQSALTYLAYNGDPIWLDGSDLTYNSAWRPTPIYLGIRQFLVLDQRLALRVAATGVDGVGTVTAWFPSTLSVDDITQYTGLLGSTGTMMGSALTSRLQALAELATGTREPNLMAAGILASWVLQVEALRNEL